jgi:hypothetical protein
MPTVNKDLTLVSIIMLFFLEIIELLVEETNKYYQQYLDTLDKVSKDIAHCLI